MTITNPIHPLYGQEVMVRQIRRLGKSVKVLVCHPDGGLISLPASETSLELQEPVLALEGQLPLFDPQLLLSLAERVAQKDIQPTHQISCGQDHLDVVHRMQNDTTASKASSPAKLPRRTHKAINPTDRSVGKQNTRRSTNDTARSPEDG